MQFYFPVISQAGQTGGHFQAMTGVTMMLPIKKSVNNDTKWLRVEVFILLLCRK